MPRRHRFLSIACVLLAMGCLSQPRLLPPATAQGDADAAATTQPAAYTYPDEKHVRTDDAVLGVSAQTGRITHFGPTADRNLLWVNTDAAVRKALAAEKPGWVNYGGDKVWPALQALWARIYIYKGGFPPDPVIDGQPWTIEARGDRTFVMTSPVSPHLGVRVHRHVELASDGRRAVITSTVERTQRNVYPVQVWTVTQVPQTAYTLLGVTDAKPQGDAGHDLHTVFGGARDDKASEHVKPLADDRAIRWDLLHKGGGKVGTFGTWCAAVYDDWIIVVQTHYDRTGSFPDASNIQAYSHGEYIELETLGPQVHLQPGEKVTQRMVWTLLKRSDYTDDEAIVKAIEALPAVEAPK